MPPDGSTGWMPNCAPVSRREERDANKAVGKAKLKEAGPKPKADDAHPCPRATPRNMRKR